MFTWTDKTNLDDVEADHINEVAAGVLENQAKLGTMAEENTGDQDLSGLVFKTGDAMTGGLKIEPDTGTLSALVVKDIDSNRVLTVDTINNRVGVGIGNPNAKLDITQNMSDFNVAFILPHIKLSATNAINNTGFVGISYAASSVDSFGWTAGALRSSEGYSDFVFKHHHGPSAEAEILRITKDGDLKTAGSITHSALSADPTDPDEGKTVMWTSDGTGSGDDGDVMMKITAGGVTKIVTLVDFSAV